MKILMFINRVSNTAKTVLLATTFMLVSQNGFSQIAADSSSTSTYYYCEYNDDGNRDANNDMIICLDKRGDKVAGFLWGNSDLFEYSRAGYLQGFTVLPLKDLAIAKNGDISFVLHYEESDFFSNYVDADIKSAEDARKGGFKPWRHSIYDGKNDILFEGEIKGDSIVFLNGGDKNFDASSTELREQRPYLKDMVFKRKNQDEIKAINRKLSEELEAQNTEGTAGDSERESDDFEDFGD